MQTVAARGQQRLLQTSSVSNLRSFHQRVLLPQSATNLVSLGGGGSEHSGGAGSAAESGDEIGIGVPDRPKFDAEDEVIEVGEKLFFD